MADLENTNDSARSADTGSKLATLGQVKNVLDYSKNEITELKGDLINQPYLYNVERTDNLFNFLDAHSYSRVSSTDGAINKVDVDNFWCSDYIDVVSGGILRTNLLAVGVAFYDDSNTFISYTDSWNDVYVVPDTATKAIVQFNKTHVTFDNAKTVMVSMNKITDFQPYYNIAVDIPSDKTEEIAKLEAEVKYLYGGDYGIPRELLVEEATAKNLENVKKNGVLNFAFMTDIHDHPVYRREYKYNILNMLAKTHAYDFVACGGDMLNYETKDELFQKICDYNRLVKDGNDTLYFICKGNHDASGETVSADDTSNILTDNEWYKIACSMLDNDCKHNPNNKYGGYFYRDFESAKIRVIVMNTSQVNGLGEYLNPMNVVIKQDQVDWLCDYALDFSDKGEDKTKWGVVILSHASVNVVEAGNSIGAQSRVVEGVLKAFMNGSTYNGSDGTGIYAVSANADFTKQGSMEFICNICGHSHYDRVTTFSTLNRPCISVGAGMPDKSTPTAEGATNPTRTEDTISMELLDIFSIDTVNRKIYATRYGAGSNREVSY